MNPLVRIGAAVAKWLLARLAWMSIGYRKASADQDRASLKAAEETNDDREAVAPMSGDDLNDSLRDSLK